VRALAEAALLQAPAYHAASRDYGESTMLEAGLYYLGYAQAQHDLVLFLRRLDEPPAGAARVLRSLTPELDALEAEFLEAYRPPLSIDRHADFIGASAALKESRELDAAGLRHGALLRYLQAVQRFAVMRSHALDEADPDAQNLDSIVAELAASTYDETIGRLFVESAKALAESGSEDDTKMSAAIVAHVLPRYLAALRPAPAAVPRPPADVTITLVRWPYT
jgi:hypothetical protein